MEMSATRGVANLDTPDTYLKLDSLMPILLRVRIILPECCFEFTCMMTESCIQVKLVGAIGIQIKIELSQSRMRSRVRPGAIGST
eukprot:scaffold48514_cov55-Attheya_sp.AAC.1